MSERDTFCIWNFNAKLPKWTCFRKYCRKICSHGIGTARAIEISEKAAAFGALAMGLSGIFTAVFLPMIITFFK